MSSSSTLFVISWSVLDSCDDHLTKFHLFCYCYACVWGQSQIHSACCIIQSSFSIANICVDAFDPLILLFYARTWYSVWVAKRIAICRSGCTALRSHWRQRESAGSVFLALRWYWHAYDYWCVRYSKRWNTGLVNHDKIDVIMFISETARK